MDSFVLQHLAKQGDPVMTKAVADRFAETLDVANPWR
jgi:hypothetical protein